jgi:Flp pilus assembly protein TadG
LSRKFHLNREDGAAAVEFALISSLLIMILFGIFEFGRVYSQYEVYVSAAREGARDAAVQGNVSHITSKVDEAASPYSRNGSIAISVNGVAYTGSGSPCQDHTGDPVQVSWTQTFSLDIPFWEKSTPTAVIKGVFRCE